MVQLPVATDMIFVDKRKEHGFGYSEDDLVYLFHLSRNFWPTRGQLAVIDFGSGPARSVLDIWFISCTSTIRSW